MAAATHAAIRSALVVLAAAILLAAAPPKPGTPAPAFVLPIVANGHGTLALRSLRGRAVYLNFFANWCKPCHDEGPTLKKLFANFRRRGVVMIGIATLENLAGARAFATKFGLPYPIVLDSTNQVGAAYGVATLPVQVFINPDGTVALWGEGPMTFANGLDALRRMHR